MYISASILEWLIKLVHYGNSNHFNALAEWFNLRNIHCNGPGCFNFATDLKTRIHDFANWEKHCFCRNFAKCGMHEFKVIYSIAYSFAWYRFQKKCTNIFRPFLNVLIYVKNIRFKYIHLPLIVLMSFFADFSTHNRASLHLEFSF